MEDASRPVKGSACGQEDSVTKLRAGTLAAASLLAFATVSRAADPGAFASRTAGVTFAFGAKPRPRPGGGVRHAPSPPRLTVRAASCLLRGP